MEDAAGWLLRVWPMLPASKSCRAPVENVGASDPTADSGGLSRNPQSSRCSLGPGRHKAAVAFYFSCAACSSPGADVDGDAHGVEGPRGRVRTCGRQAELQPGSERRENYPGR